MNTRWVVIPLFLAALTVAVACSGDDDPADSTDDRAASTSEAAANGGSGGGSNSGGSNSGGSGGTDAPDLGDFPVPLPDWADAVVPDLASGLDVVLFFVPLDQQEATIAFYEDWTANQPENYLRTDSTSGGVSFQSEVEVGEEKTIIAILSPLAGDDFVTVSLTQAIFE